jgi:hypothetical protein
MNLNTESIINDVTKVVQNGLKDILSEIETKYKLYEESHNCVVKMAECMSKQVKQDGTSASVVASAKTADVDTGIYVSRAEFNALVKQNQELIKHIVYEFESQSKQNQDMMKQLAIMKQDMVMLLSKEVIDISNDSDEETKVNITLKIEEIKKETIDNLIGGSLETIDDKAIVAGDNEEEEEDSQEEDEDEDSQEEESEEEDAEDKQSVPIEKHVLVSTNASGLSAAVEEHDVGVKADEDEDDEESNDSDEEKEQLDEDEKVVEEEDGEEEEEFYEIVFNSTTYCTDDEDKGSLYILTSDGDVGEKVGHLEKGKPIFY